MSMGYGARPPMPPMALYRPPMTSYAPPPQMPVQAPYQPPMQYAAPTPVQYAPPVQYTSPVQYPSYTAPQVYPQTYAAPQVYPQTYAAPQMTTYAPQSYNATALDLADGKLDGQYYGATITPPTTQTVGAYSYGASVTAPALGTTSYMAPATYGAYGTSYAGGYPYTSFAAPTTYTNNPLALDAADGVIDGRIAGSPIIGTQ